MSDDPGPPFFSGGHPHNFDAFVAQFDSVEAAYHALISEIIEAMQIGNTTPGKYQLSVRVRGFGITARGWISETGEVNAGTAFVFRSAPGGPEGPPPNT